MEKSVEFEIADYIKEVLEMKEVEPEGYSPLTLAYIGDSIYDLVIKTKVISEGNKQVKKLHQETSSMVQASAQSEMMRVLQPLLTEEEHAVYRRGRNASSFSNIALCKCSTHVCLVIRNLKLLHQIPFHKLILNVTELQHNAS